MSLLHARREYVLDLPFSVKPGWRAVLHAALRHANHEGCFWASRETLARATGHRRAAQVGLILDHLVRDGWLTEAPRPGKTTEYTFTWKGADPCALRSGTRAETAQVEGCGNRTSPERVSPETAPLEAPTRAETAHHPCGKRSGEAPTRAETAHEHTSSSPLQIEEGRRHARDPSCPAPEGVDAHGVMERIGREVMGDTTDEPLMALPMAMQANVSAMCSSKGAANAWRYVGWLLAGSPGDRWASSNPVRAFEPQRWSDLWPKAVAWGRGLVVERSAAASGGRGAALWALLSSRREWMNPPAKAARPEHPQELAKGERHPLAWRVTDDAETLEQVWACMAEAGGWKAWWKACEAGNDIAKATFRKAFIRAGDAVAVAA